MITLNICASRIPGMTHAEYCRYLKDNHARLVLGTEPVVRHMKAYVQQHVFDGAYGGKAPSARYDSVSHIIAARVEDHAAATCDTRVQGDHRSGRAEFLRRAYGDVPDA